MAAPTPVDLGCGTVQRVALSIGYLCRLFECRVAGNGWLRSWVLTCLCASVVVVLPAASLALVLPLIASAVATLASIVEMAVALAWNLVSIVAAVVVVKVLLMAIFARR